MTEHATKTLSTVEEGIEILGGAREIAKLFDITDKAVFQWKYDGWFPPDTYYELGRRMMEKGVQPNPRLWRMKIVGEPDSGVATKRH